MTPPVAQALAENVSEVISEDKELVLAFKAGDSDAYDVIYRRHEARVYNVCRRMLSDPQDAQEAAQETFLRVYQALGRFNGRYQLGAWIGRIATNVCLDQIRSKGRKPVDAMPIEVIDAAPGIVDDHDPETFVIRNAESRRVRRVLESMSPLHRAAVVLRDFEGFSYAEIATTLKISEPQVKALIHRARKSFKKSWTSSVASILLPTRLFQKIAHKVRGVETTSAEHVSQGMATSVQVVQSCSAALQHCGQVLADKVVAGAVATAVVVGAATGAVVTDRIKDGNAREEAAAASVSKLPMEPAATRVKKKEASKHRKTVKKAPQAVAPAPAASEPAAQPTPEATPSPSTEPDPQQSPSDQSSGSHQPQPDPTAKPPAPAPVPELSASLGFTRGGAPRTSSVTDHSYRVDCGAVSVQERYNVPFSDGDRSYGSFLDLAVGGTATSFALSVYPAGDKYGGDVRYEGTGSVLSQSRSGDRLKLSVSGTYTNVDNDAGRHALPSEGTFDMQIELDCKSQAVVTEVLGLAG